MYVLHMKVTTPMHRQERTLRRHGLSEYHHQHDELGLENVNLCPSTKWIGLDSSMLSVPSCLRH